MQPAMACAGGQSANSPDLERPWRISYVALTSCRRNAQTAEVGPKEPYVALGHARPTDPITRRQIDAVIHRVPRFLLAAEITFGRLHRDMTEQKLDLFQLSSGEVTQPRATPTTMPHAA